MPDQRQEEGNATGISRTLETLLSQASASVIAAHLEKNLKGERLESLLTADGDHAVQESELAQARIAIAIHPATRDNHDLIKAIATHPGVNTLQDAARVLDHQQLVGLVQQTSKVENPSKVARDVQRQLFHAEPTAVVQGLVENNSFPLSDPSTRSTLSQILSEARQSTSFDIRKHSVLQIPADLDAFRGKSDNDRHAINTQLRKVQRVATMVPADAPDAIPALLEAGITSATQVSNLSQKELLAKLSGKVPKPVAKAIHAHAANVRVKNDSTLTALVQQTRGSGLAAIDGRGTKRSDRITRLKDLASQRIAGGSTVNLDQLFGSMDFCPCSDCSSILSPAAYLVELFQFLRNNNLNHWKNQPPATIGYANTILENLLRRRPDLICIELTCANTNTLIPYIDLANEIMESFVVHLEQYIRESNRPRKSILETFNVEDETASELLSAPQHTNYNTYCILKEAVYPFNLPYYQPIDEERILLKYLQTSRYELIDIFRKAYSPISIHLAPDATAQAKLEWLHGKIIDRAAAAEFLGFVQEDYIIVTKQAFWPIEYFKLTKSNPLTVPQYEKMIGIQEPNRYWNYPKVAQMQDSALGLTMVKDQFLPRSGISYLDLVSLLQTRFVNPNYPKGRALFIMQSIRFSYAFLMTMLGEARDDRHARYGKLIQFLNRYMPLVQIWEAQQREKCGKNACNPKNLPCSNSCYDKWVCQYFEPLGQLIVLESGDGPVLPVQGWIKVTQPVVSVPTGPQLLPSRPMIHLAQPMASASTLGNALSSAEGAIVTPSRTSGGVGDDTTGAVVSPPAIDDPKFDGFFGYLSFDGMIRPDADSKEVIGVVASDGRVLDAAGNLLTSKFPNATIALLGENKTDKLATISPPDGVLRNIAVEGLGEAVQWKPIQESCSIDRVRLKHLDGSPVTAKEYDRMQRFIRLWRRLGWTIDEVDKALSGLRSIDDLASDEDDGISGDGQSAAEGEAPVDFANLTHCKSCGCNLGGQGDSDCCSACQPACSDSDLPDFVPGDIQDITPGFLKQLVAIQKLLDLTGIPLDNILALWADIGTNGNDSLFAKLFLKHNIVGADSVFRQDPNGNYLPTGKSGTISDHSAALRAATGIKSAEDLTTVLQVGKLKLEDPLDLISASVIYRYTLLVKMTNVKIAQLPRLLNTFPDALQSATATLAFLKLWNRVDNVGFSLAQLDLIVSGYDDPKKPLGPTKVSMLRTAKTIFDGLSVIQSTYPDIKTDDATAFVNSNNIIADASLLFDQAVVSGIVALVEGTQLYEQVLTNGPEIAIPPSLSKMKYVVDPKAQPSQAKLQVTGILTDDEAKEASKLSDDPKWTAALAKIAQAPAKFFRRYLATIFPPEDTTKTLLAGDINDPNTPDKNTAPGKRRYFLQYFLPYLRVRLSDKMVTDTMTGISGISDTAITGLLLSQILRTGPSQITALEALKGLKQDTSGAGSSGWSGYLVPSITDTYTFVVVGDEAPTSISVDGEEMKFSQSQDPSDDTWATGPKLLVRGKLYLLDTKNTSLNQLQWQTASTPSLKIPSSAVLPSFSLDVVESVFANLFRSAFLINGFNLDLDEVTYFYNHPADFADINFNTLKLEHWKRIQAYAQLRDSLPGADFTLIDLFRWSTTTSADASKIPEKVHDATLWDTQAITSLIGPKKFNLSTVSSFRNEVGLIKLQKAITLANKVGIDMDKLFLWADPNVQVNGIPAAKQDAFAANLAIAADLRHTLKSRFSLDDWEQVVQPLNNQLRENQKNALVCYLVVQEVLKEQGVNDADGLFEFFLIDVQMSSCLQTSRIKQAISSVQLYVQRILMGLEAPNVGPDDLDVGRWGWLQNIGFATANKQVFLQAENWAEPTLRDDKSPFYLQYEADLMQKDITMQSVTDAMKKYLFSVDTVSDLIAEGLFIETSGKAHIFARTRSSPYGYYYRNLVTSTDTWSPWMKMDVDVPNYDVEDSSNQVKESGAYLVPAVINGRLFVFLPQIVKKTQAGSADQSQNFTQYGNTPVQNTQALDYWEIKMSWTEFQNNRWTQKQTLADAFYDIPTNPPPPPTPAGTTPPPPPPFPPIPPPIPIQGYIFVPRIDETASTFALDILRKNGKQTVGRYTFTPEGQLVIGAVSDVKPLDTILDDFDFQYLNDRSQLGSYQAGTTGNPRAFSDLPNVEYFGTIRSSKSKISYMKGTQERSPKFSNPLAHPMLSALSKSGDLADVYAVYGGISTEVDKADAFGADSLAVYGEQKAAYSIYSWEIGYHAPMHAANMFLKASQFDNAIKMCQYVFNPLAPGTDQSRYWQFAPFREVARKDILEQLFASLAPESPNDQITAWRDAPPFSPHVVARSRPVVYMKYAVMKYIEILIAQGDWYFRQFTLEAMPLAIQCYVLAEHIYGPKGQTIPMRGKIKSESYGSLLDKWDAFDNAGVDLELAFPFSNQITTAEAEGFPSTELHFPNIFGFATTRYFCLPDNPKLRDLRSTLDDRLFKIRHCQDINGVVRSMALWEPPLDVGALVAATAAGLSLSSILNDLNSPMPNFRFSNLLRTAIEVCGELRAMGAAFLAALEKQDGETLAALRAHHDSLIHTRVMDSRKAQLDEANKVLDSLAQNRLGPQYRMRHFLSLVGGDLKQIPSENDDFQELAEQIDKPILGSGMALNDKEQDQLDKAEDAAMVGIGIGILECIAGEFQALPITKAHATPLGCGLAMSWGFPHIGQAVAAKARQLRIGQDLLSYASTRSAATAGLMRQLQERVSQANLAGYEIKNIDKQAAAQRVRIQIATNELNVQQQNIDNAAEVESFLKNKYTNAELYSWYVGETRSLYHQYYTMAYSLAKTAERALVFERPTEPGNRIQLGYWTTDRDGLLAGERLALDLQNLQAAYQSTRGWDFEMAKAISLRQLSPLALMQLREQASCDFDLPEVLFDMDFPGHYQRRIKAVSMTLPCTVGPYTSVNGTLRLMKHRYRKSPSATSKSDYLEKMDEDTEDERFATSSLPITAIAVSSAQNDAGTFMSGELAFRDERFMPFEGAGAISSWRLSLPAGFRSFDYETITDVVLRLQYTSLDGGDALGTYAAASVAEYVKAMEVNSNIGEGLFTVFDLAHEFASEFTAVKNSPTVTLPDGSTTIRAMNLRDLNMRLPAFTKTYSAKNLIAQDIYLFSSTTLVSATVSVAPNTQSIVPSPNGGDDDDADATSIDPTGEKEGSLMKYKAEGVGLAMSTWRLKVSTGTGTRTKPAPALSRLWMVVRYVMKSSGASD